MRNKCEVNDFFIKLRVFRLQLYYRKHFHRCFSKILTRGSEELHFRTAFCITPVSAEHQPMIASILKYGTAIHNSTKCFTSHEKMKKCFSSHEKIQPIRNLATKTLFNMKMKQTIVSYKMDSFSVHYHRKIEQKRYTANWQNFLKQKQNWASLY